MESNAPLTREELQQLDDLMEIQGGMRLPKLHGYLTSIISGPELMRPDGWLPWVWQGREDATLHPQLSTSMGGIRRLYNTIREHLEEKKPLYPLLSFEQMFSQDTLSSNPALIEWCRGYMKGVEFTADTWRLSEHLEALILLVPIILGSEDKKLIEDYLGPLGKEGAFDEVRTATLKNLPAIIPAIDAYWTKATNRPRYTIKVASHRLCPCGSGKEFEICCGERTLH